MAQTQRITRGSVATSHSGNETQGRVTYHNTDVVEWDSQHVTLKTGGWQTATTKARMNQAANHYGLRFAVYQKAYSWYVTTKAGDFPFSGDRFDFERDTGKPVNA